MKHKLFWIFLFFYLFMAFYPPRLLSRLFLNFFIVILLEPQTPEWNPLIPKLRSTDLFFDYKEAKFKWNNMGCYLYIFFISFALF